ncbi:hypothetical protein D3C78_1719030 [compost metagenome]
MASGALSTAIRLIRVSATLELRLPSLTTTVRLRGVVSGVLLLLLKRIASMAVS